MLATFAAKPQWSTINTFYRTQNLLQCQVSLYSLPERMIEMLLAKINESLMEADYNYTLEYEHNHTVTLFVTHNPGYQEGANQVHWPAKGSQLT